MLKIHCKARRYVNTWHVDRICNITIGAPPSEKGESEFCMVQKENEREIIKHRYYSLHIRNYFCECFLLIN